MGGLNERLEHGNKSVWHWWTFGRNMGNKNMEKQWDVHIISHHNDAEKDMGKSQEKYAKASVLDLRIKPLEWCLQRKKGCWSSSFFKNATKKTGLRLPARWEKTGERGLAPSFWILVTGKYMNMFKHVCISPGWISAYCWFKWPCSCLKPSSRSSRSSRWPKGTEACASPGRKYYRIYTSPPTPWPPPPNAWRRSTCRSCPLRSIDPSAPCRRHTWNTAIPSSLKKHDALMGLENISL